MPLASRYRFGLLLSVLITATLAKPFPSPAFAQDEAEQQAAREFNIIATAYNNGVYEKAATKWAEFIKKYPKYKRVDEAQFYLGNSLLNLKKYSEAIATYTELAQKHPQFDSLDAARFNLAMARFQIASTSNKPEDFQAAAKAFEDLIAKHQQSPYVARAYYYLGDARYVAQDVAGASDAYKQLIDKFPDNSLAAYALYFLGVAQQELKQIAEAAATYENFLKQPAYAKHELAPEIRLRHGICFYELEKFPEAEKRFGEVATDKDSPFAAFALLRQGQCRMSTGKSAEAASLFAELIKSYPESPHAGAAQLAAGKCYFEDEKYDDVKKMLTPLVSSDKAQPNEVAEAAYYLARTHLKQGKPEEALRVIEPAAQEFGDGDLGPFLLSAKADALNDIPQRRAESSAVYQQVLAKFPQHELAARALYMSAASSYDAKDYDEAQKLAKQFLDNQAYAEHVLRPEALFIAAESSMFNGGQTDLGKRQQAETLYRQLIQQFPENQRAARAHLRIAWCLLEAGKNDETVKYLAGNGSSFQKPQQKAEAFLMTGQAHARSEKFSDALTALDQARKEASNWERGDELLIESAQALRQLDNLGEAKNRLNELLSKFSDSPRRAEATFQLGEIARSESNNAEAVKRFTEVTEKYGDSDFRAPALYALAAAHFQAGEFDKVSGPLDQFLTSTSDDQQQARGQYLRGLVRQRLEQFGPAAEDLAAFLASNPPPEESLDARFALALCHVGAKKYGDAVAVLNQILASDANYRRADLVRYELGHALLAEKKQPEAADAFEQLATKHADSPKAAEAWFHVGQHHEKSAADKDDAEKATALAAAAKAYGDGLKTVENPTLKEKLAYKLADMQFQRQQFKEATETLKQQLAEFPAGDLAGPARYLAGESAFQEGDFAAALPLFEQVVKDNVQDYIDRSLYRAGECAGSLKNWPASQKNYEQLIQNFPKFQELNDARYGLAFAWQNQNQYDKAIPIYEQVAEQSTGESGAKSRFMLGEIAFAKKEYDDAVFHFGAVVSGFGYKHWQGEAQYEMARCLVELGKKPQAIAAFKKMQTDFPEHEKAGDAARLLAELQN